MSEAAKQRSQFIMMFFAFSFGMILSNLLGQAKEPDQRLSDEILLTYKGIDKTLKDLPPDQAARYRELSKTLETKQRQLLSTVALQWYAEEYAVKHQVPIEDAVKQLFELQQPTSEEVNEFYTREEAVIAKPFFEVKGRIEQHLTSLKAKQARVKALDDLILRGDLAVLPERHIIMLEKDGI